jgi:1-deoxy-D-xylulose-5-phosphate synthase
MGIDKSKYNLLFKVNDPKDIRDFSVQQLQALAQEIREYIIDVVSQTGGHFGGSMGAVELTLALHKVFDTPRDLLVWDVGHQAYPHKIITGRRDAMLTLRKLNGISGFLKREESIYDVFGAGHTSTSISAALGMAIARDKMNEDHKVVAIIGDGAMTAGMAYEALNNAGLLKSNLIVVLNDNQMSIAPNMWQFANYFNEIISHPEFQKVKGAIWDLTGKLDQFGDRIRKLAVRLESGIKSIVTPGMLFEALGFRYFGPINGHSLGKLVKIFSQVKDLKGPILVHVITEKGKGYKPAEGDKEKFHGISPFDKLTGQTIKKKSTAPKYTSVFAEALVQIIRNNPRVVGITAAMPDGTGLNLLKKEIPENFFDVGIAEQHAVTFAAGLAAKGVVPVAAIYSTFLQRAFDQIIHDVALQKLHVVFALDRGGLVGADGPTHHGAFDLTYLRLIPNMVVMAPKDESELRDMLFTAIEIYKDGPVAIRYPRGEAVGVPLKDNFDSIPIGKGEVLRKGNDVALLAVGLMTDYSMQAAEMLEHEGIDVEVINMRFIKPLDTEMLDYVASRFDRIVTLEENTLIGGFGSGVLEYFAEKNYKKDVLRIGLPDQFVEQGSQSELHALLGIDPKGISERIKVFVRQNGAFVIQTE